MSYASEGGGNPYHLMHGHTAQHTAQVLAQKKAEYLQQLMAGNNPGNNAPDLLSLLGGNSPSAPQDVSPGEMLSRLSSGGGGGGGHHLSPFEQLQQMAAQMGAPTVDYNQALKDSQAAIRDAYAHDIAAIRSGSGAAKHDTAEARRKVEQSYAGLAQSYFRQGKKSVHQGKSLAKDMTKNSRQAANFLKNTASQQMSDQAKLAQGLGIQDAMPAASAGMQKENQHAVQRLIHEGAGDANRQLGFTSGQQQFLQRGGQNSRLEGTNQSAALLQDLQHFLQGQHQQIEGLKGNRSRELASNASSVASSVASMQEAAQKDQWSRLMDLAGLRQDQVAANDAKQKNLHDYQLKQQAGGGMPGAENFANAQKYLSQMSHPQRGSALFDQFLNSDAMTKGEVPQNGSPLLDGFLNGATGNHTAAFYSDKHDKLTPYKAMQLIEQQGKQQGLSEKDIQLLRLAVWAQMG